MRKKLCYFRKQKKIGVKMSFKIKRSEQYYKMHIINTEDVISHGMEKACILGNIDKYGHEDLKTLHERFPYIDKFVFYSSLHELVKDELVTLDEPDELQIICEKMGICELSNEELFYVEFGGQ
jgi:hypothetical protein